MPPDTMLSNSNAHNISQLEPGPLPDERFVQKGWEAAKEHQIDFGRSLVPLPPNEWVGRTDVLNSITDDWESPDSLIVGLVGFGGEGKTSIVSSWVHKHLLIENSRLSQPKGIFYWDFYKKPSGDEFFESAMLYMGAENLLTDVRSAHDRASCLSGAVLANRYLFVLDGLEAIQNQEGEDYGLLQNSDLKDFLTYFASSEHDSLCLVTSRAPLIDLMDYVTYIHREVDRLNPKDGLSLLRYFLKDHGTNEQLEQVVTRWNGHALTLSLIGAYIRGVHDSDIGKADIQVLEEIQAPEVTGNSTYEKYYEKISRILRRYSENLTIKEQNFLKTFSAFRLPVSKRTVIETLHADQEMVMRLVHYRILRYNYNEDSYVAHTLIRQHYLDELKRIPDAFKSVHLAIKEYYLSNSHAPLNKNPSLQDLVPFIEAVHHLCSAKEYEQAYHVLSNSIDQGKTYVLTLQLGAYDTRIKILSEFFPDKDISRLPYGNQSIKYFILKETGFCLTAVGRLKEARSFCQRNIHVTQQMDDPNKLTHAYRNLASLYVYLGELSQAAETVKTALDVSAEPTAEPKQLLNTLALHGWISHLLGKTQEARSAFKRLYDYRELEPEDQRYLYRSRGIFHADYLSRIGDLRTAKEVAEVNLRVSQGNQWLERVSRCYRILGDVATQQGDILEASEHYYQALKVARGISHRPTLIEALKAHGSSLVQRNKIDEGWNDLSEALGHARKGNYRINEANIQIGFSWLLFKQAEQAGEANSLVRDEKRTQAQETAKRAFKMSKEMGYYWGVADSEKVLTSIKSE